MTEAQDALFELPPAARAPGKLEFERAEEEGWRKIRVHFRTKADHAEFCKLIGRYFTLGSTKVIWYPELTIADLEREKEKQRAALEPPKVVLRYPVYIVSRGKFVTRPTAKTLERLRIPYKIVVLDSEYEKYAQFVDASVLIRLPFGDLGQGNVPARNWVKQHSTENGHERHWLLDDDVTDFAYFDRGLKVPCEDGSMFAEIEEYCDRYDNISIAGLNLITDGYFVHTAKPEGYQKHSFTLNVPVLSTMLVSNLTPHMWHGESASDLIEQSLKEGWCTVLFDACFTLKRITRTVKGKYVGVDYRLFRRNKLRLREDAVEAEGFTEQSQESHDALEKASADYEAEHPEGEDVDVHHAEAASPGAYASEPEAGEAREGAEDTAAVEEGISEQPAAVQSPPKVGHVEGGAGPEPEEKTAEEKIPEAPGPAAVIPSAATKSAGEKSGGKKREKGAGSDARQLDMFSIL